MDRELLNRSRDYSCCNVTFRNDNCSDVQRGVLCVAKPPFVHYSLQDSAKGHLAILSIRRLYAKVEDFEVGKWTIAFGMKTPVQIEIAPVNIVDLFTCCTPTNEDIHGQICRCDGSFSVLVLHKEFSDKLKVQIELKTDNRQFVPLHIVDVLDIQDVPVTYQEPQVKKKKLGKRQTSLNGYFCSESEGNFSMLGDKVKAYGECIKYKVKSGDRSSSGSAILDQSLSHVCGIHNVQLAGSCGSFSTSCVTMGTSVFQMASQLSVQQFQCGTTLPKKYLPAVLSVIVANSNRINNTELVKNAYHALESIITTSAFHVAELRELTVFLHQSGIVDLHWHTDHRAYRVTTGLRLLLAILHKYNDLPVAQSPGDGWVLGEIVSKEIFEEVLVQYGGMLDDCFKRMMESVKEYYEIILMCLEYWNLTLSISDLAKKKLITTEHQDYLKTVIDNNDLEDYPKLQSHLLRSYVMITDYLRKSWIRAYEEAECLRTQACVLEHKVIELSSNQVVAGGVDSPLTDCGCTHNKADEGWELVSSSEEINTSFQLRLNKSPPSSPSEVRREAAEFCKKFVDEQPSPDLLRAVAKDIYNSSVTVDALCIEFSIPNGEIRNIGTEVELWVRIFRLLEFWRNRDAKNNTQRLAEALYNLNLARSVEECELFKRHR